MDKRIDEVIAEFVNRYGERKIIREGYIRELIALLLQDDNKERMLNLCAAGHAPLRAVVYQVEKFATDKGLVKDDKLADDWKQDVGRLVGAIVHKDGYASDGDTTADKEDLQKTPRYFHYAAKFHKEETLREIQ